MGDLNFDNWLREEVGIEQDPLSFLSEYLKQEPKYVGGQAVFQCPYCQDRGEDNLTYSQKKGILKCFANESHAPNLLAQIAQEYGKKKGKKRKISSSYTSYKVPDSPFSFIGEQVIAPATAEQHKAKARQWYNTLVDPQKAYLLNNLKQTRGINKETVEKLGIGYREDRKQYTIPKVLYTVGQGKTIINFEFRPNDLSHNFGQLSEEEGGAQALCQIGQYHEGETDTLWVTEGFIDAVSFYQYFMEKGQRRYHIVTSSSGVGSLTNQLQAVRWEKYRYYVLAVDNDEPSDKVYRNIQYTYNVNGKPIFADMRLDCGKCRACTLAEQLEKGCCKDFNDYYRRKIIKIK